MNHGNISTYTNHKCRCSQCRNAWAEHRRGYRAGRRIDRKEWNEKIGLANRTSHKLSGSDHGMWKGDNASLAALHLWVARWKAKTGICIDCGKNVGISKNTGTQWSNIDHKYNRNLDDFEERCHPCHEQYDIKYNQKKHGLARKEDEIHAYNWQTQQEEGSI